MIRRTVILARWMIVVALAGLLPACARTRAQTEPELPPLAAPLPPPRVLPPLEGGPITVPTTAEEPPPRPQPAPRRRTEPPRSAEGGTRTEPPKPEPVAEAPPPQEMPSAQEPVPALQLAPLADEARAEAAVRRQLVQADRDLQRVDYRALGSDARAQYETAKRFTTLAEQAIKDRNLIFAQTLADKAATIAAVLAR